MTDHPPEEYVNVLMIIAGVLLLVELVFWCLLILGMIAAPFVGWWVAGRFL